MSTPNTASTGRLDSPDPASHSVTPYDQEGDWVDEESGNDDMDFEESTGQGESEELEYFETTEDDDEGEFQGMKLISNVWFEGA